MEGLLCIKYLPIIEGVLTTNLSDRGVSCATQLDVGIAEPVFVLENGATIEDVIIGPNAVEGIHCRGSCTITRVWFRDVCEGII